jgi:hypothetical protein
LGCDESRYGKDCADRHEFQNRTVTGFIHAMTAQGLTPPDENAAGGEMHGPEGPKVGAGTSEN